MIIIIKRERERERERYRYRALRISWRRLYIKKEKKCKKKIRGISLTLKTKKSDKVINKNHKER